LLRAIAIAHDSSGSPDATTIGALVSCGGAEPLMPSISAPPNHPFATPKAGTEMPASASAANSTISRRRRF
jgi:hypothetical protein